MRIISKTIYLSSVFFLVYPMASFASLSSEYASLVDTSQNQTFESRPQAAAIPKRPVPSSFAGLVLQRQEPLKYYPKFANVKFIVGDGELDFGYTEFSTDDLCKQAGYVHNGCPAGYIKDDEWDKVQKVIVAILEKYNVNVKEFFESCSPTFKEK